MDKMDNPSRVLVLDFDDTLMATFALIDAEVSKINYRASSKYHTEITQMFQTGEIDSETYRILLEEHFDLKDRILEEVDEEYKGRIDYSKIILPEYFYPKVVEYVNYLVKCGRYDEVYIVSHYNASREAIRKAEIIKKYLPGVKFVPVPFHIDKYEKGVKRQRTNKAMFLRAYLGINGIDNYTLIDDSLGNVEDWKKAGGVGIIHKAHSTKINKLHDLNPFNIMVQEDQAVPKLPEGRGK